MTHLVETYHRQITEETLMQLADDMAAAAVSFSSHGYDQFIRAREAFQAANKIAFQPKFTTTDNHY